MKKAGDRCCIIFCPVIDDLANQLSFSNLNLNDIKSYLGLRVFQEVLRVQNIKLQEVQGGPLTSCNWGDIAPIL